MLHAYFWLWHQLHERITHIISYKTEYMITVVNTCVSGLYICNTFIIMLVFIPTYKNEYYKTCMPLTLAAISSIKYVSL